MIYLLLFIAFILGMSVGGIFIYKHEEKIIKELNKRCADTSRRLDSMIKDEEQFIDNMWPNRNSHIFMQNNLADYLRDKYMRTESSFEDYEIFDEEDTTSEYIDCDDESDNLYI